MDMQVALQWRVNNYLLDISAKICLGLNKLDKDNYKHLPETKKRLSFDTPLY